jgi:hypothetical protein
MNDLGSEFFYSGMAHIPPGLLIIVLYWRTETENVFHTRRDFFSSPLLFIACVLAIAWLVGLMVEALIFVPIAYALKWLSPHCKLASWLQTRLLLKEQVAVLENENAKLKDKKLEREKRRQGYFRVATTIMCRNLSVIFLFAWLASLFAWFKPPEPFSNLHWDGYHSFGGFCAFILMWFLQMGFVIKKADQPKKVPTSREIRAS